MKKVVIAFVVSLACVVALTGCSDKIIRTKKTVTITMEQTIDKDEVAETAVPGKMKLVKADTTYAVDTIPAP